MTKADAAAERKNQIVRATVDCIAKYGYHNFSMQDVARVAGVSKGIIHYYFLNKDDLMMSVLAKVAGDIEYVLQSDMRAIAGPERKLIVFVEICLDVVRSTREYYQVNMDFWTQINQKAHVRAVIAQHYVQFRQTCATVLAEGVASGVFRTVDPDRHACIIVAMIDGISLQWLFDDQIFNYEQMTKEICDQILRGLQPCEGPTDG